MSGDKEVIGGIVTYEGIQFGPNFSCGICGESWTGLQHEAGFWAHIKACRDAKEHPQPEYFDESNCAWGE